jgi:hypothetical protein
MFFKPKQYLLDFFFQRLGDVLAQTKINGAAGVISSALGSSR